MKILCVIDSLGSGGAQRQLTRLAINYKRNGHQVEFLTYSNSDFFEEELKTENININKILTKSIFERIIKVRRFIRKSNQDLVISFLDTPNFLVSISAIGGRKWKFIACERSADKMSFIKISTKIKKRLTCLADYVVSNSRNAENLWRNFFPSYSYKFKTIYNSIYIPEDIDNVNYFLRKDGKIHVVIAATYREVKNINALLNAVSNLNIEDKEKIVIDWYGRIDNSNNVYIEANRLVNQFDLTNIIRLHEETKEIFNIMKKADFVALFSLYEGLPNCICEGMMLSKPIIMSMVSDYNIFIDNSNGYLCNPYDSASIKEALIEAINTNDNKIIEMGKESKKKAELLFDNDKNAMAYLDLLNL